MKVGDLVRFKHPAKDCSGIGLVIKRKSPTAFWMLLSDGDGIDWMPEHIMEVISESR